MDKIRKLQDFCPLAPPIHVQGVEFAGPPPTHETAKLVDMHYVRKSLKNYHLRHYESITLETFGDMLLPLENSF